MGRGKTSSLTTFVVLIAALAPGPACDHHRTVPDDQAVALQDTAVPDTTVPDAAAADLPPPTGWIFQAGCKDIKSKQYVIDLKTDGKGNSYVLGWFELSVCFGSTKLTDPGTKGAKESFVAKVDAQGKFAWVAHVSGFNHDYARALALDQAGNVYLGGSMDGDLDNPQVKFGPFTRQCGPTGKPHNGCFFVAQISPQGKFQWVNTGNNTLAGISIKDMGVDAKGQVHLTGFLRGSVTLGPLTLQAKSTKPTHSDIYLARLSPGGKWLQAGSIGNSDWNWHPHLAVDATGYRYVTLTFKGQALIGSTALTAKGAEDLFVARVDPAGKVLWVKQAGGVDRDSVNAATVDSAGNLIIAGDIRAPATFGPIKLAVNGTKIESFVAKITSAGKFLWATTSSGSGGEWPRNITVDAAGNSYIAGSYSGTARFGSTSFTATADSYDGFVARLDKNGTFTGARTLGGADHDRAEGVTVDQATSVYVAGTFRAKAAFGSYTLTPNAFWDLFVWKIPATDM